MKYHVYKKPYKFMYPYIAVNGHLPKRELPERMRHMHYNSVYIRDNICENTKRENRTLLHEYREMRIEEAHPNISYKKAHRRAGY